MSLGDEVRQDVATANVGNRSRLPEILERLPKKEAAELLELLNDPNVSAAAIRRALQRRAEVIGPPPAETTVVNWKRGKYRGGV